ncbi:organic cation transporter protein isoform X4 [Cryptotermes secundus]|uniref:organic cation transporter protein isoform X4 n=1 Tax=Cryptotermes secundus TaxID=105785 RepID=UPI000CD7B3BD|nr:organic cation transporter protein isoform X4 [Cryptotermes secundus]
MSSSKEAHEAREPMDLDEILDELGHFGKFQSISFLVISFPIIFSAIFALSYIFTAGGLNYRCRIQECEEPETSFQPGWLSYAVPFQQKGSAKVPSRCLRYGHVNNISQQLGSNSSTPDHNTTCSTELFNRSSTVRCDRWVYEGARSTILREWDITCEDNQWALTMVGTVNNVGQFIGMPIAGVVSDRLATESVRWLLTKGRLEEARDIILKAATTNGIELSQQSLSKIEFSAEIRDKIGNPQKDKNSRNGSLMRIFQSKILLRRLLSSAFCWFSITFVFFGLSLNSVLVGGNQFTNFILVALIELPAYVVFYFAMDRLGRKCTLCLSLILSGVSCISFAFLPTELGLVQLLLFMLGKFGITISFAVVFVFTAELFPTELRHSTLACCSMLGRIGSVIAPQTPLLIFKTAMDLDEVLDELKHFGKFQATNYLLLSVAILFAAMFEASFIFTAGDLNYRCRIPGCDGKEATFRPDWLQNAVPFYQHDGRSVPRRCLRYEPRNSSFLSENAELNDSSCSPESFDNNSVTSCEGWVYDGEETTILREWDLTCEENLWKLTIVGTVNNIGQFVGLSVVGLVSDRIGRKTTLIASMILSCLMGVARSIAWSYEIFLLFEFLDPALGTGVYTSALVLGMELVGPRSRVFAATMITSFYAIGQALTGIIAWWLQNWRLILRASYLPSLLCISYYWFIPESVRWLLTKKRTKEASDIILSAARKNGVCLSEHVMRKIRTSSEQKETEEGFDGSGSPWKAALSQVFKSKTLLMRLTICIVCWVSITFVYFGLTVISVSVGGNKYTSFILAALIELPAYVATYLSMNRFGRKFSLCSTLLISGIPCTAFAFLPPGLDWVRLLLFLAGKFAITISYTVMYVYNAELFPTQLRHSLLGACVMFGQIGSILAPQTPLLDEVMESLPLLLFSAMSVFSGLLALYFPETLNAKLPDTIEEAENIGKHKRHIINDESKYEVQQDV